MWHAACQAPNYMQNRPIAYDQTPVDGHTYRPVFVAKLLGPSSWLGTIFNKDDGTTLPGASVLLINARDTTQRRNAITDDDGNFNFDRIESGGTIALASFVGYALLEQPVNVAADRTGSPCG